LGTLAGRLAGVRRIIWNIRCSEIDFSRYSPATRWVVVALVRLSRVPWAVASNSCAGQQAHQRLGYRPRRWVYLPNGFDTDAWKPEPQERAALRRALGLADGDVVVGMVARVDPQKDHAAFLEAASLVAARHPQLRVLLVGRDTDTLAVPQILRPVTQALGERSDVQRVMQALDILVSSSAYGEGFPNVIGEAMACGVACVATDVGDSRAIIGSTGLVVAPRDVPALAAAIQALIEGKVDRSRLGASARTRIESEYAIERCLRRYSDLLQSPQSWASNGAAERDADQTQASTTSTG
jgi:glycosyltransferase involved in cell wall biosynthesis